jgi:hypothetical protein
MLVYSYLILILIFQYFQINKNLLQTNLWFQFNYYRLLKKFTSRIFDFKILELI